VCAGYPPLDLLDRIDFIEKCDQTVAEIARECRGIAAIVGSPVINKNSRERSFSMQRWRFQKAK